MKSSKLLLAVSVAASVVFLLANSHDSDDWLVVFKLASIVPLVVLGFRVNSLLGTALGFGVLGDFLLGVRQLGSLDAEKLFLVGLAAFLLGHLVYIAMFRKYRGASGGSPAWVRMLGDLLDRRYTGRGVGLLAQFSRTVAASRGCLRAGADGAWPSARSWLSWEILWRPWCAVFRGF